MSCSYLCIVCTVDECISATEPDSKNSSSLDYFLAFKSNILHPMSPCSLSTYWISTGSHMSKYAGDRHTHTQKYICNGKPGHDGILFKELWNVNVVV